MYHNQSQFKSQSQQDYGKDLEQHRIWLMGNLAREKELRNNAEKSLEFLMQKFTYLFDTKKYLINEIERCEKEIARLEKILK